MDMIIILAAFVGFVSVPGLIAVAPALIKSKLKEKKKYKKQRELDQVNKENEELVKDEVAKAKEKSKRNEKGEPLTFYEFSMDGKPIDNPSLLNLHVLQSSVVSPENSKIFKGTVHVKNKNGSLDEAQTMYFYFPDLYIGSGDKKQAIKPNLSPKGNLVDEAPYLIHNNKDGKYYTTIVPLAEVYSGIEFDFIKDSKVGPNLTEAQKKEAKLSDFIDVELLRDDVDDFIPVDFSDPDQKREYDEYIASMKAKDAVKSGSAQEFIQEPIIHAATSLAMSKGKDPQPIINSLVDYMDVTYGSYSDGYDSAQQVTGSTPSGSSYYDQFRYIPRGSSYYRMGLYGISNGSNNLNSSAQSSDPYAYYNQFRYIPKGSVLDQLSHSNGGPQMGGPAGHPGEPGMNGPEGPRM